jgi:hypothetical protein
MRTFRNASLTAIGLILLISGVAIWAPAQSTTPILVTGSDLVGCRSTPSTSGIFASVVTGEDWSDAEGGFKICWTISFDGSFWNYTYLLTNVDGTTLNRGLSHWLLEVSTFIPVGAEGFISNSSPDFKHDESPKTWDDSTGNPGLPPANIYGIKFEPGNTTTFQSTQPPVWGDFYAKDGGSPGEEVIAYNTGFGTDPTGSPFTNWIPTPDTTSVTTTTTTSTSTTNTTASIPSSTTTSVTTTTATTTTQPTTTSTTGTTATTTTSTSSTTTTTSTTPLTSSTTTSTTTTSTTTTTDPSQLTTTTTTSTTTTTDPSQLPTTTTLPQQTTTTTPVTIPAANTWGMVALGLAFLGAMAWMRRVRRSLR